MIKHKLITNSKILLLTIIMFFIFSRSLYAEEIFQITPSTAEKRTITLKGTIDPRLYAYVVSRYRATDVTNKEVCLSKKTNWGTGSKKALPDFVISIIEPDINSHYKVTVPIDYAGEDLCGYKYFDTQLTIRRDKDDDLWSRFTVVSHKETSDHIPKGDKGGYVTGGRPYPPVIKNSRKHFQLPKNTKIKCFTRHYERSERGGHVFPENDTFLCFEIYDGINGVDKLVTTTINVDIEIDEAKNEYVFSEKSVNRGKKKRDHFRDYRPGLLENIKRKFTEIFNQEG